MYAIIETGGKQFRVQEGQKIVVDRLPDEVGAEISIDKVLLVGGDAVKIGTPFVEGAKVNCKVLDHTRGEKIKVFKMRRRKSSKSLQGHRQDYTALSVMGISA